MRLKRILKHNDVGEDVKILQEKLKELGFYRDRITSHFGQTTLQSVLSFQKNVNIKIDGIVNLQTWNKLNCFNISKPIKEEENKLDILLKEGDLIVYKGTEKISDKKTLKNTIFLFINNSSSRPDIAISKSNSHYVIGRKSSSSKEDFWDGKILRTMDDKYYLNKFENQLINDRSIFIEICNYGELFLKEGIYYNHFNKPINESEVLELNGKYYELLTDNQIDSIVNLVKYLKNKWQIDLNIKIDNEWFNHNENWFSLGGLRTFGQIIKDKSDLFPQPNLITGLNSI
jgi:N-acetyl-anhydromuramyl-L-alanine amidase AmpD